MTMLPFVPDQSASAARALLRVMLLDDDPFILELMHAMLAELDVHDVQTTADGRQALAALAGGPRDLLICDLSMPGMDGIEFLRLAASGGYGGSVILLSSMDDAVRKAAERLARSHGLKVLGEFKKPISMKALATVLAQLDPTGSRPAQAPDAAGLDP